MPLYQLLIYAIYGRPRYKAGIASALWDFCCLCYAGLVIVVAPVGRGTFSWLSPLREKYDSSPLRGTLVAAALRGILVATAGRYSGLFSIRETYSLCVWLLPL